MRVSLRGNLQDFGIAEVFQLIGQQRKTGVLEIDGPSRVRLAFDEGAVVWAAVAMKREHEALGQMLVRCGLLTRERLAESLKKSGNTAQSLPALLVPGAAGFLARRADLALCGLLFFGWAVAALGWRAGVTPDPLSMDWLGPLVFATSGVVALLAHFVIARIGLAARKRA